MVGIGCTAWSGTSERISERMKKSKELVSSRNPILTEHAFGHQPKLITSDTRILATDFRNDIYDAVSLKTCVNKRLTKGAPSEASMKDAIAHYESLLSSMQ